MNVLTPNQLEQIAERDRKWRNPRRGVFNAVAKLGLATNAGQAANDRHHLLNHAFESLWRPHERHAAHRRMRRVRVAFVWSQLQWLASYLNVVHRAAVR